MMNYITFLLWQNKKNFRYSVIVFLIASMVFTFLVFQYSNVFWGHIVSGLFVFFGLGGIIKCIKKDYV